MEQYISDYREPRTPSPIFPCDKEGDRCKGKDGKGGQKQATNFRRRSITKEESVEKGETIDTDWESWQEREDLIKRECEESGDRFRKEDDYNIVERQADDLRRAQDIANYRKGKEAVNEAARAPNEAARTSTKYSQAAIVRTDYLTNRTRACGNIWTPEQTERWKRDNLGSDESWHRRQQEEWNKFTETQEELTRGRNREEDEADRSERRSRDSRGRDREDIRKENLIAQERIRIASCRRFGEKQKRDERDRKDRR